jgi:hypothetical protein
MDALQQQVVDNVRRNRHKRGDPFQHELFTQFATNAGSTRHGSGGSGGSGHGGGRDGHASGSSGSGSGSGGGSDAARSNDSAATQAESIHMRAGNNHGSSSEVADGGCGRKESTQRILPCSPGSLVGITESKDTTVWH